MTIRLRAILAITFILAFCLQIVAVAQPGSPPFVHFPPPEPVPGDQPYAVCVRLITPGQLFLVVDGLGKEIPFTGSHGSPYYYADIPASCVTGDSVSYEIKLVDQQGKAYSERYALTVGASVQTWNGSEEPSVGISDISLLSWSSLKHMFYDLRSTRMTTPDGTDLTNIYQIVRSPARTDASGSTDRWPNINCTVNQPRDPSEANPHSGVDLDVRTNESVWGVAQSTVISLGATRVITRLAAYPNVVFDYQHLGTINVTYNSTITQTTKIGTIGADNHLHLGFAYLVTAPSTTDPTTGGYYYMPQQWVWRSKSQYNDGRDLDFVEEPSIDSTGVMTVVVKGKDVLSTVSASTVRIVHRRWGTSTWTDSPMTLQSGNTWTINLKQAGPYSNCDVEYYIYAKRSGTTYVDEPVYRPAYYNIYQDNKGNTYAPAPGEFCVSFIR